MHSGEDPASLEACDCCVGPWEQC